MVELSKCISNPDVSPASEMNRTNIVFVQPLKMLDVTSALTPFLTHTHTLMLQYMIRSKQRIHANDKASAAILGFVIFLRDTPTLRVLCRDLEPACSRSDRSTSWVPATLAHLRHRKDFPEKRTSLSSQATDWQETVRFQTVLCSAAAESSDRWTEEPAYAVWLPPPTPTLTWHQHCRSTFWAEMTDGFEAPSLKKLIAPHHPHSVLCSQGAGLEWWWSLQPSAPPSPLEPAPTLLLKLIRKTYSLRTILVSNSILLLTKNWQQQRLWNTFRALLSYPWARTCHQNFQILTLLRTARLV